jgi:CxxC motif-containing protein
VAETREFVCIVCPRGCSLSVTLRDSGEVGVRGNSCKRGEEYGRLEVVDPRRSLTSTVRVEGFGGTGGAGRRRLPVRSSASLPLGRIMEAARALDPVVVDRPVECGEVVVKDILGLGVDIIATDRLERN